MVVFLLAAEHIPSEIWNYGLRWCWRHEKVMAHLTHAYAPYTRHAIIINGNQANAQNTFEVIIVYVICHKMSKSSLSHAVKALATKEKSNMNCNQGASDHSRLSNATNIFFSFICYLQFQAFHRFVLIKYSPHRSYIYIYLSIAIARNGSAENKEA